jgi:signal transduction histidine kinase
VNPVLALGAAAVPVGVGLLVLRARQRRIGWLLVAHGICFGALLALGEESAEGAGAVVDQLGAGAWVFLFLWLVLIAYLLPDGHAASRFWRRWMQAGLVGVVLFLVGAAGDAEGFRDAHHGADLPLRWLPQPVSGVLGVTGLALTVLLIFGSFFAVRTRLRRSAGEERLQLLWLVWGALTVPIALLTGWAVHFVWGDRGEPVFDAALALSSVALPATIGVAILRHRLFDIELVLSRTLTYLLLVVAVVSTYALLLLATDRVFGNGTVGGLLAVGVVAVAVHPAYSFLRRWIERWVYGLRSEPHEAIRLLADRADAADPEGLIDAVTAAVAEALRADRARIGPVGSGVPLLHRGERLGDLAVDLPPGRILSAADKSLLDDLARHAAVLVRAERLTKELRESRSSIVTAREEERRRLRRDLHDGVGPSLAAIVLKLNAAQSRADPDERNALLTETRDEVRSAIAEVRRLVDDLRPPAIDEVGLVGAIRQRAVGLSGDVAIEVSGPETLPALPAAIEVAAYRIASEALTNVARHSGASRCRVAVAVDGAFELTVADNGTGTNGRPTRGMGWTSMRERAAELGGSCTITGRPEGGLLVRAVLPLGTDHPAEATS